MRQGGDGCQDWSELSSGTRDAQVHSQLLSVAGKQTGRLWFSSLFRQGTKDVDRWSSGGGVGRTVGWCLPEGGRGLDWKGASGPCCLSEVEEG
jgi:hypothetical protein